MPRGKQESDLRDADLVVTVGGRWDGFWWYREDWDQRVRKPTPAYRETGETVAHPALPGVVGMKLVPA